MSLFSTYWYRIADIKPQLRSHVRLHRHIYRGETWYVLQDPSSNRQHRFNKSAYYIIGKMDGKRTVAEIWDTATTVLGDDAPTQDEVLRLLSQLHSSDAMQSNIPPDMVEIIGRSDKQRGKWKQRISNPLALRFPLVDPDRFLKRWMFLVKPLFSWIGALLWILVVGSGVVLAIINWPELTLNMADRVLNPKNLLLLWLVYPLIKLAHEMGHAFAVRIWGGEVHEMGIILLALTPIPYVEASASGSFPDKRKRMAVAAAGMSVELFIAALALFLWLSIESGLISAFAYNVMLIGGVSTVLFNGNPLLRFDGYYVLSDSIEMPNLGSRSTRYLGYLTQRYIFGVEDLTSPVTGRGEQRWFVGYGIISFCYKMFIMTALILFISSKFFFIGIIIALWATYSQFVAPVIRNSSKFYNSAGGRRKRTRFITASFSIAAMLAILLFVVPAPLRTTAQGVVTLPGYSQVRAGTNCFISEIITNDGMVVQHGDPLIRCEDPFLKAEVQVLRANLREAQAKYDAEALQSRVKRGILKKRIAAVETDLNHALEREDKLTISSPNKGTFVLPNSHNLLARYVKKGELLGYIMGASKPSVVIVVNQDDIALVRERTRHVELRLAGHVNKPFTATIDRETPAASDYLPSPVLGTTGGGDIPVNPSDPNGVQTLTKTFQFEIKLTDPQQIVRLGERVYAMFDHGYQPIAIQWYRSLRRLFLSHFHV